MRTGDVPIQPIWPTISAISFVWLNYMYWWSKPYIPYGFLYVSIGGGVLFVLSILLCLAEDYVNVTS